VLLVLVLLVAGVWLLIARPWESKAAEPASSPTVASEDTSDIKALPSPVMGTHTPTPTATKKSTPTPTLTPTGAPTPTATATKAAAAPCTSANVTVEALTDSSQYAAGKFPQMSIKLTNHGPDCTMNVGTTTQKLTITSGTDTWWRSTDCQVTSSDMIVTIKAGQTVTTAKPVPWQRERSSVSTCGPKDARPKAPGGGASYHLTVEIGGIESEDSKLFMLY